MPDRAPIPFAFPARLLAVALLGSPLCGCAADLPASRLPDVQSLLAERLHQRVVWRQGAAEDLQAQAAVERLLADELTLDAAVQIALLDNPAQQAVYEELGIAQADLVQAGLLGYPVFAGHLRWPDSAPRGPNLELAIVQPFLDVFARPARERMAQAQADAAVARVADSALHLAADVGAAFIACQAAQQRHGQLARVVQAAELASELARRQRGAGNVSELEAAVQRAAARQAQLDLLRVTAEVGKARERLARLLGPSALHVAWRIAPELPAPPAAEPPLPDLEALAIAQRLDLQAARAEHQSVEGQLESAAGGTRTATDVGLSWEQDTDGQRVFGPTFEVELPFGGQRRADVLRLQAQERGARRRVQDLELQARSEVRLALARARSARELWQSCANDLVPLQAHIVALSQQHYDAMLLGTFTLLQARQNHLLAEQQAVEALADLWLARLELARAVGGSLPGEAAPAAPAPAPPLAPVPVPAQAHEHHHPDDKP